MLNSELIDVKLGALEFEAIADRDRNRDAWSLVVYPVDDAWMDAFCALVEKRGVLKYTDQRLGDSDVFIAAYTYRERTDRRGREVTVDLVRVAVARMDLG